MRKNLIFILALISGINFAQNGKVQISGEISFVTAQTVYVKFDNTEGINIGDTLFTKENSGEVPAILVEFRSTKSISGKNLTETILQKGTSIFAYIINVEENKTKEIKSQVSTEINSPEVKTETPRTIIAEPSISGRFSISSYSSLSNIDGWGSQRWRYRFSLNGDHLVNSKVGLESYITFSYRTDRTDLIKDNINNALKIYSLAVKYSATENLEFSLGRRINRLVTNLGAYDGLDVKYSFSNFDAGIIIGSRPNWGDYSFNMNFFQFGAFINRNDSFEKSYMRNSFGIFEQKNHGKTDRRFLYFQHSNDLIENFRFFFSSEADLYKKLSGIPENTFRLTSLYLSLRYSPSRIISVTGSFDSRKNVIYYETFQNYADSILEAATRQGFRIRINIRPINKLTVGAGFGYSKRETKFKATQNVNLYANYSRLPIIETGLTGNFTYLSTNYLDGTIAGLRLMRDIFSGSINLSVGYRNVNYQYKVTGSSLKQNIFDCAIYLNFLRNLSFSIDYEGIFEGNRSESLIFANLNTRF